MTKHKKRRTAMTKQRMEKIQRIAKRKSDRVGKAIMITITARCKTIDFPAPKKTRESKTGGGENPERYTGYTAIGRQKMRGCSTIPRGIY
ncbi:hypothetical protein Dpoa2040_001413 [Dickeya sp. CFBP 2040]|uniref:hypothetical protein n=1 Tax=Dickeya sp. CFBP 2040 TaxID=2718531 RepID=UPI00144864CA|nr:hypothetical protein [Dickeya sp. CFBP 2040]NKI74176.1 hypothetical protein [Dickeya sp. CFBP 2040]